MNILDSLLRTEKRIKEYGTQLKLNAWELKIDRRSYLLAEINGLKVLVKSVQVKGRLLPLEFYSFTDDILIEHRQGREIFNGQENI